MALIDDIIAYWKLDNNFDDEVDNNDMTNAGATYTASGKINGAYDYDGINDASYVTGISNMVYTKGTISLWFKTSTTGTVFLGSFYDSSITSGVASKMNIILGSITGAIADEGLTFQFSGGNTIMVRNGTDYYQDGNWHHVVFGSDGSNYECWIDGVDETADLYYHVGSDDGGWLDDAGSPDDFNLGARRNNNGWDLNYDGIIDEVAYWGELLSSTDIASLYNSGDGLQYPFSVADTLTLTTPDGAESWDEGDSENITWTDTGTIANVKLELSTNNGSSYSTIIASTTNDGTYAWTIPRQGSSNCLVRISDVLDSGVNDVSDAVFTINNATISLTNPDGGESLTEDDVEEITWTSTGTFTNVMIELSVNDKASYSTIIASTPNDGSYNWTVPGVDSSDCFVRISDAADNIPLDVSSSSFTITSNPEPPDPDRGGFTKGTRGVATRYPVDKGLTAKTESQTGRQMHLLPERASKVLKRRSKGIR